MLAWTFAARRLAQWHVSGPLFMVAGGAAEGLGRLHVAEAAPLLQAGWERATHSHARAPFLAALHRCAPQAARILADEGREDCEPAVREIAAAIDES